MSSLKKSITCSFVLFVLVACGGTDRLTRKGILEWAEVLQVHIAISEYNNFPERLGDVPADLRGHLSRTDAWGTELFYRRLRGDIYHLISAGPDGQLGNEDDLVAVNGHFQDATTVYKTNPVPK